MYDYAVVEYLQQYREHSKAQHSTAQHRAITVHKANQVRANQNTFQKKNVRTYMHAASGLFWSMEPFCKSPVRT